MLSDSDVALARIADYASMDGSTTVPAGFFTVSQAALGLSIGSKESYANGEYTNRNGAAAVLVGTLNGQTTAILDFRGSVNEQDSVNDLQNINNQYQLFTTLVAAFDAWVAREGIANVAVTGHSLGGAMDQIYMASHANSSTVGYSAETFGSPGALIAPATDNRIDNIQISDDPAVYLGENRAYVGGQLQSNPALAAAAIFAGPQVFPGLTSLDVLQSIPDLNANYVNRGNATTIPAANGSYSSINSITDLVNTGLSEHLITSYLSRLKTITGDTGDSQQLPTITPTTVGTQIYRFFDGSNGTHFYTASATERDADIASRPDLTYEGVGLNGTKAPSSDPNSVPVYRFFDSTDGSHFYTISTAEEQSVMATRPDLKYEGVAFYEHAKQQTGDAAVYRFFDSTDGTHFYTPNASERSQVLATRPDLVSEGVAFYTLSA